MGVAWPEGQGQRMRRSCRTKIAPILTYQQWVCLRLRTPMYTRKGEESTWVSERESERAQSAHIEPVRNHLISLIFTCHLCMLSFSLSLTLSLFLHAKYLEIQQARKFTQINKNCAVAFCIFFIWYSASPLCELCFLLLSILILTLHI